MHQLGLAEVARLEQEMGAILAELGRQPRAAHAFFLKYQDRILFGSDGSPEREVEQFWTPHWRYLETYDEYFYHPAQIRTEGGSPGHGRWNISGIGLPDEVLRKVAAMERAARG